MTLHRLLEVTINSKVGSFCKQEKKSQQVVSERITKRGYGGTDTDNENDVYIVQIQNIILSSADVKNDYTNNIILLLNWQKTYSHMAIL